MVASTTRPLYWFASTKTRECPQSAAVARASSRLEKRRPRSEQHRNTCLYFEQRSDEAGASREWIDARSRMHFEDTPLDRRLYLLAASRIAG